MKIYQEYVFLSNSERSRDYVLEISKILSFITIVVIFVHESKLSLNPAT